jgi:hypothetical protein
MPRPVVPDSPSMKIDFVVAPVIFEIAVIAQLRRA